MKKNIFEEKENFWKSLVGEIVQEKCGKIIFNFVFLWFDKYKKKLKKNLIFLIFWENFLQILKNYFYLNLKKKTVTVFKASPYFLPNTFPNSLDLLSLQHQNPNLTSSLTLKALRLYKGWFSRITILIPTQHDFKQLSSASSFQFTKSEGLKGFLNFNNFLWKDKVLITYNNSWKWHNR